MSILNVIFAALAWIAMFALIPLKRIKTLYPVGFVAVGLLFAAQYIAISLGLIRYTTAIIFLARIPFFHYVYAFAYGILLIHFMRREWVKKLPVILGFALINLLLTYIIHQQGVVVFDGRYNFFIDLIITFATFCLGVWIAEGLWKDRIYEEEAYAH